MTDAVKVISEEDLKKAIADLAPKKDEPAVADGPAQVGLELIKKTVAEAIKDNGSKELKKSLDVSDTLQEFASVVGSHVDASLETLNKAIKARADNELLFLEVLTGLKKSIDDVNAKIDAFGTTPAAKPASAVTSKKDDILEKNADAKKPTASADKPMDPITLRKSIADGLGALARKHPPGTPESQSWTSKAALFEAAGKITDADMAAALAANK